jgi:DNA-binding transcriptional ArsR family regulator
MAEPRDETREDLLLHPVRLRVILAVAGRQVTAGELAGELPDVPQATLYRAIRTLVAAGILSVVKERQVRNTTEKTYALPNPNLALTPADLAGASPADHLRLFTRYLGLLLGYYARYVQDGVVDLARDHIAFGMFPVYMSDAEAHKLGRSINALFQPLLKNQASPRRRRFVFGLTSLLDVAGARRVQRRK